MIRPLRRKIRGSVSLVSARVFLVQLGFFSLAGYGGEIDAASVVWGQLEVLSNAAGVRIEDSAGLFSIYGWSAGIILILEALITQVSRCLTYSSS